MDATRAWRNWTRQQMETLLIDFKIVSATGEEEGECIETGEQYGHTCNLETPLSAQASLLWTRSKLEQISCNQTVVFAPQPRIVLLRFIRNRNLLLDSKVNRYSSIGRCQMWYKKTYRRRWDSSLSSSRCNYFIFIDTDSGNKSHIKQNRYANGKVYSLSR